MCSQQRTTLNVEGWTLRVLRVFVVLVAIRLEERKVEIVGITEKLTEEFSTNAARDLVDPYAKPMNGVTHLFIDLYGKFPPAFTGVLKHEGVKVKRTPPRSPNCNAICERFVGTLRREQLDRMIFFGEASLHSALKEFVAHYHSVRTHQAFENEILEPGVEVGARNWKIAQVDRLRGLLRCQGRVAAYSQRYR